MFTLPFAGCDSMNPLLIAFRLSNMVPHTPYCFCYNCLNKKELEDNAKEEVKRTDTGV